MRLLQSLAIAAALLPLSIASASAEDYVALRAGVFDIDDIYETANFGVEYRGDYCWQNLMPIVGVEANADGSLYGYAGAGYDFMLGDSWALTPSFAVGAYHQGDDSRDLGGTLEFRSALELDYLFANAHRVGVSVEHLSNAGIYEHNSGTNGVMVNWSIPLNF